MCPGYWNFTVPGDFTLIPDTLADHCLSTCQISNFLHHNLTSLRISTWHVSIVIVTLCVKFLTRRQILCSQVSGKFKYNTDYSQCFLIAHSPKTFHSVYKRFTNSNRTVSSWSLYLSMTFTMFSINYTLSILFSFSSCTFHLLCLTAITYISLSHHFPFSPSLSVFQSHIF